MNDFTRQTFLEEVFNDTYGIKPIVYFQRININQYKVKFVFNNKEIILTENLKKGRTENVTLELAGNTQDFKSMYDAEIEANKLLRA